MQRTYQNKYSYVTTHVLGILVYNLLIPPLSANITYNFTNKGSNVFRVIDIKKSLYEVTTSILGTLSCTFLSAGVR